MTTETKDTIQRNIAKIREEIADYERLIEGDPTYDDEHDLTVTLARIERACFALRILQSRAMSENRAA